jgi:hypothetical protein
MKDQSWYSGNNQLRVYFQSIVGILNIEVESKAE